MLTASRLAWVNAWEGDLTPSAAAERSQARVAARIRSTRYYSREATARLPEPAAEEARLETAPELRVVTKRRPRWSLALLALAFAGVLVGMLIIAPVLINSATTGVESQVGRMEANLEELTAAAGALSAQISTLSSPERLAEQAAQLGLGPARSVRYVDSGIAPATEGATTIAGR